MTVVKTPVLNAEALAFHLLHTAFHKTLTLILFLLQNKDTPQCYPKLYTAQNIPLF
ncbi:hypothetical protein AcetOrient_orf01924 [Acetobacter orientalis]|uniref:Uncharacterized protein n=1 Tax=Acetobacter orientalis TaxID=146474 RepID=A0A2Z5ZGB3_9PROT|nr:hypothetical protein AcetOrient_orf01924 [Acetobacter orientalis]